VTDWSGHIDVLVEAVEAVVQAVAQVGHGVHTRQVAGVRLVLVVETPVLLAQAVVMDAVMGVAVAE